MRVRAATWRVLGIVIALVPVWASAAEPAGSLADRLMPLIGAHEGQVALSLLNLKTGERFDWRPDVPMPTASLIKFPVMVEAYRQAAEGRLSLDDPITLAEADKVPGSGILTPHIGPGARFALRDAVRMMITFSDNTATNLVLDRIGLDATARAMEALGCPNTKIHSKVYRRDTSVFPERSNAYGLGSTTAGEMVRLCQALERGELVSPEASTQMIAHLETCDDRDKFPRYLPPGTRLAFKTGSVNAARTAAGLIWTDAGPVALCVLTAENADESWVPDNAGDLLCAVIAREVHGYFQAQARARDATASGSAAP